MRLVLPREHGSWGILLVPFVTGVAVTGEWNLPALLALVAIVAVFLGRPSLEVLIAGKGGLPSPSERAVAVKGCVLFAGLATAATVPLLAVYGRWLLLWLATGAMGFITSDPIPDSQRIGTMLARTAETVSLGRRRHSLLNVRLNRLGLFIDETNQIGCLSG